MIRHVSVSLIVSECRDCQVHRQPKKDGGIGSITVEFCEEHRL